jgi:hypothetical protein
MAISFIACQCNDIACVPPPPSINIQLLNSNGFNPILNGELKLEDITFRNISKPITNINTSDNGILSFVLDQSSAQYMLGIKNITIDTFDITMTETKGECCSSYSITSITNDGVAVNFVPYLSINL